MMPWLVLTMTTPRPPSTRGMSVLVAYTRRPGLLTRLSPLMTGHLADVLELDAQEVGWAPSRSLVEGLDEALVAQDLGDGALGARCRHEDLRVARAAAVADAREHVGDRI